MDIRVSLASPLLNRQDIAVRFDEEIQGMLAELGQLGVRLVQERTPTGVSAGGGGLKGSIFTQAAGSPGQRQQTISSTLFYAPIVETGRQPGRQPPRGALNLWVQRKLAVPLGQVAHVAFLIGRRIGRAGYRGHHMFERAAQQLEPIARARAEALAARVTARIGSA